MKLKKFINKIAEENPQPRFAGRIQNLDLLKLISLVLVLCLHSVFALDDEYLGLWSPCRQIYSIGVLAIPMFFTVSGYQLLGKENRTYRYVAGKIWRMLVASFVFCVVVTFIRELLWHNVWSSFGNLIEGFFRSLFFRRGVWGTLWFMGGLSMVYLLYPLVNRVYIRNHVGFVWLTVGVILVQTLVFLSLVLHQYDSILFEPKTPQPFRLWNWVGYFCLGGLIKRYRIFSRLGTLKILVSFMILCVIFVNEVTLHTGMWWCEYFYASLPVMITVATLFSYVMKFKMNSKLLKELVGIFFPAYLICDLYLAVLNDSFGWLPYYAVQIVLVAVVATLGILTSWLLLKIPAFKKLVTF